MAATGAALREALYLWMRRPREMFLANLAAFFAMFLPWALAPMLPAPARTTGFALLGLWSWGIFSSLCGLCALLDAGEERPWTALAGWWRRAWAERLGAYAVALIGAVWLAVAAGFYRGAALPVVARMVAWGGMTLLGVWWAAATLCSLGGAAPGGRPWRALWKACALLPPAFGADWLAALALFALALVLPASGASFGSAWARFWMAPFVLCPVFTLAFLAAYLTALVRLLLARALGTSVETPPTWMDLWNLRR